MFLLTHRLQRVDGVYLLLSVYFMFNAGKNRIKINAYKPFVIAILSIVFVFLNSLTSAQSTLNLDSLNDSNKLRKDSTDVVKDTIGLPISSDKLESIVNYQSKDSIIYDAKKKLLYLYKEAEISYEDIKVKADYIQYEQDSSRLTALELDSVFSDLDSVSKSSIAQGEESSTFSSLLYNFKSKRALVENAYSQFGEGFILSNQVKRNNDNSINGLKNIYTTCNEPHPHFGIAAKKIKIIPNKVAITGSANLVVENVPTPLYLPFGLFPLTKGQRSGFILPNYDMSQNLGFGLIGGGYYFAINKHWDAQILANIYAKGTWLASNVTKYNYKYRFNGSLQLDYGLSKTGAPYEANSVSERTYRIIWHHDIDRNVMPGARFNANVNYGSTRFQRINSFDPNAILQNSITSSISYSKSWEGKPYNFSVALRHNQNTGSGLIQLTLPEMNFNVNQIFPFQFRKEIIKPRWYEKIGASYQVAFTNQLNFYDSLFSLQKLNINDFQNGIKHTIPINATYNIFKFVNATFGATYNEFWYSKRSFKQYNFAEEKIDTTIQNGFTTARSFDVNANFSTRIYGIKVFRKGFFRGVRHVITPTIGVGYRPDFGRGIFNYYYNTSLNRNLSRSRLSYFDGSIIGAPPDGEYGGLNFSVGNILGLKVRDNKDTVTGVRKINLIDGLTFTSGYNLAVDSFQWQNLAVAYRTTLVEGIILSGSMNYSPYAIDTASGLRKNEYYYHDKGKILRFENANLALGANLPLKKNKQTPRTEEQQRAIGNESNYADFNIPWTLNFTYTVNFVNAFQRVTAKDSLIIRHNVQFNGDVNLTSKWRFGMSSGYDINEKSMTFTSIDIFRDLHCWEMRLQLSPFGFRRSYNFGLNVKAAVLQDLKLNRRKDFRDFL